MTYDECMAILNQNPEGLFFGMRDNGEMLTLRGQAMRFMLHSGIRFEWFKEFK